MKHPLIGITLDYETTPTYSKLPWYALRENYCTSVSEHGALAFPLPHDVDKVEAYLDLIDGLLITGGAFDVPPHLYGESVASDKVSTKTNRTLFEWAITQGALARKIPILGICGGEQLLNVVLGGTLIQHIPDTIANCLLHEQPNPRTEPGHTIRVVEGTLLHSIVGKTQMAVNSAHHQAVAKPGHDLIINAVAPDGVVEGVELPATIHPFCLGVEWHPEYHVDDADIKIMAAFVETCQ